MNTDFKIGDYRVRLLDPRNWIVERETGRPARNKAKELTGGNVVEFVGYYGTLTWALRRVLEEKIKGAGATDAKALRATVLSARDEILAAVERLSE